MNPQVWHRNVLGIIENAGAAVEGVGPEKMIPADLKDSDDAPSTNHYGLFYNGPSAISI